MISKALVFQHMDDEPPGLFGEFLRERGAEPGHCHAAPGRGDTISCPL